MLWPDAVHSNAASRRRRRARKGVSAAATDREPRGRPGDGGRVRASVGEQPSAPARAGPQRPILAQAGTPHVYPEKRRWPPAPRHSRARGQDCPRRGGRGAERGLRGGLLGVQPRLPAGAEPSLRLGRLGKGGDDAARELGARSRHPNLLGTRCIIPPGSCGWIEEPRLLGYHLDAESFLLAAHDMDRLEFAALDTLQHGRARNAERAHRFAHWHEAIAGYAVEAGHEVIGEADAPGAPGVSCSPAMIPSLSRRWMVDGATPSATAAFLIVSSSPSGAPAVGSKQGMSQWRRRLPTRPAVKR